MSYISQIAAALVAGVASPIACCITYYKTKRLRFFDVYFEMKAKAYADYIREVVRFSNCGENIESAFSAFQIAKMYCSDDALKSLETVMGSASQRDKDGLHPFISTLNKAVEIYRKDMQNCRDYKFE